MAAIVSVGTMLTRLGGLVDTKDLNDFQNGLVKNCLRITADGKFTSRLSEKQLDEISRLFERHFAG
jgi:gamma-glutamylcysteine synthetase